MILAALFLLFAQDVPAAPQAVEDDGEIVVRATYGTTTMLFDKGADNKLRNCRIMVSSGSQRRDTNACQATPVCFEKTADTVTDCVALTALEPATIRDARNAPGAATSAIFDLPKLVQPKPAPLPGAVGPATVPEHPDTDKQRVKPLPPLPKDESNGPVIRITNGNAQDK